MPTSSLHYSELSTVLCVGWGQSGSHLFSHILDCSDTSNLFIFFFYISPEEALVLPDSANLSSFMCLFVYWVSCKVSSGSLERRYINLSYYNCYHTYSNLRSRLFQQAFNGRLCCFLCFCSHFVVCLTSCARVVPIFLAASLRFLKAPHEYKRMIVMIARALSLVGTNARTHS